MFVIEKSPLFAYGLHGVQNTFPFILRVAGVTHLFLNVVQRTFTEMITHEIVLLTSLTYVRLVLSYLNN